MVFYGGTSRAKHSSTYNVGGGEKKMGLYPTIGNNHWFPIYAHRVPLSVTTVTDPAKRYVNPSYPLGMRNFRPMNFI
jgi:hypothetical protein